RQARAALTGAARRHLELALRLERLDPALQKEIGALASGKLASWASVSRHSSFRLHPPLLRRTAAVVRDRSHVFDLRNSEADGVQRAHGRLAPGARPLDAHLEVL